MEMKDNSVNLKLKMSVKSFASTTLSWHGYKDVPSACSGVKELVDDHEDRMQEYAEFDKEKWKQWLRRRVVNGKQGRKKTLEQIREYFEITEEEQEWFETWIEIFRKVRLEEMSVERAEQIVKHDRDPYQVGLQEIES